MKVKMEKVTSTSAIVPEVLREDNYERWSVLMEHYLVAQDLWDVVQSSEISGGENKREWMKKNALALHAIGISCGREAFDQIKNIRSAKGAWDTLAAKLKPPPMVQGVTHGISKPHQGTQAELQETLREFICDGDISSVKQFLRYNPDARSPQMLEIALQVAITYGHKNMARYLYRDIPKDFLQGDRGFFLLQECVTKEMFDIALDLLHRFPELAFECPGSTPIILTLAQTPPPFLRLNELGFWGRWIYNCTRVKVYSIKPRGNPASGVGVIQYLLRKCILPLHKFHLVGVLIGLLCWLPAILSTDGLLIELSSLLVAALLNLDLAGILIAGHIVAFVNAARVGFFDQIATSSIPFGVLILFLVILRILGLGCGPIGMPLLVLGPLIWLLKYSDQFPVDVLIIILPLFSLLSMPLLIFVIQIYKQKLMDEYALKVVRFICRSLSNLDENKFVQSRAVEATFQAIKNGIPEIVIELITKANNANILWSSTDLEDSRNMFTCAVAHRQEKVAQFLHENGASKDANMVTSIDEDGNNTLHLAAKLTSHSQLDHISGAALQLQNEIHWFKSVEGIVPRFYNKQKNKDGETPTQLFVREHGDLLKEAEEWMKEMARSYTVVGALVVTIMFAAAFTVPGGNNEDTGFPIFLNKTCSNTTSSNTTSFSAAAPSSNTTSFTAAAPSSNTTCSHTTYFSPEVLFMAFAISDAISLFAAASSVLMFMGILTARYAFQDFYISLPIKLISGLSSLFISIAAMMVAFSTTLYLMLRDRLNMVIPIIFLASIPVTLFMLLQSPLLVEIYTSTFRPDIFHRKIYLKYGMRVCSSLNWRRGFRMRKGWMVVIMCALPLLYVASYYCYIYLVYRY